MGVTTSKTKVKIDVSFDNAFIAETMASVHISERDALLERALALGLMAEQHDELGTFLDYAESELNSRVGKLREMYRFRSISMQQATVAGEVGEEAVLSELLRHVSSQAYGDVVSPTGNVEGAIKGNKTGDIVAAVDGEARIGIEVKFDKQLRFGDLETREPTAKGDTALSQLAETGANRLTQLNMIVFDEGRVDSSISTRVPNGLHYFPQFGFIVIIDTSKGDYSRLLVAYEIARMLVTRDIKKTGIDPEILDLFIARLIQWSSTFKTVDNQLKAIKKSAEKIGELLGDATAQLQVTQEHLSRYLDSGTFDSNVLLDFYRGSSSAIQENQHE